MGQAGNVVSGFASAIKNLIGLIVKLSVVITTAFIATMAALSIKAIKTAASFEILQTQFITLLGSATKARQRFQELKKFAAETPFQLPDIAKASRVLEALTDGALSTGEGLKLVGDAAAIANESIQSLGIHVGRVFQGLQTGRAVGESLARLQELGLLSGAARTRIEALQKAGIKGAAVWGIVEKALQKNKGAMALLSKTATGLFSTVKDNLNIAFAEFGQILLPIVKVLLEDTIANFQRLAQIIRDNADSLQKKLLPMFKELIALSIQIKDTGIAAFKAFFRIIGGPEGQKAVSSLIMSLNKILAFTEFLFNNLEKAWDIGWKKIILLSKQLLAEFVGFLSATLVVGIKTQVGNIIEFIASQIKVGARLIKLLMDGVFTDNKGRQKAIDEFLAGMSKDIDAFDFKLIDTEEVARATKIFSKPIKDFFEIGEKASANINAEWDELITKGFKFANIKVGQNLDDAGAAIDRIKEKIAEAKPAGTLKRFGESIFDLLKKAGTGFAEGIEGGATKAAETVEEAMKKVRSALGIEEQKSQFQTFIDGLIKDAKEQLEGLKPPPQPTLAEKGTQAAALGELGLLGTQKDELKELKKQTQLQNEIKTKLINFVIQNANFGLGGT